MSTTIDQPGTAAHNGAPVPRNAVAVVESDSGSLAAFASQNNFIAAQRIAKALSNSTLVPKQYQGEDGFANCLVAMELAGRTGASVLMVMQNLHVIQGRPSWSAAFLVGSVNTCGRFSPIRYEWKGKPDDKDCACRAVARDLRSGDVLEGEWITWGMVKAEGWLDKPGSKWKTMPGQMFRYRAASFWARTFAPEISLGMHTADEAEDMGAAPHAQPSRSARDLNAAIEDAQVESITSSTSSAPADPAAAPATHAAASVLDGRTCEECGARDGQHKTGCVYLVD